MSDTLDTLQGEGSGLGNHIVDEAFAKEMKELEDWDAVRTGPKAKPKENVVEKMKHPNLGAGYLLPFIEDLLEEMDYLLEVDIESPRLKTCRPLAAQVYYGIKER